MQGVPNVVFSEAVTRDPKELQRRTDLVAWICEAVPGESKDAFETPADLLGQMATGVLLCRLINAIRPENPVKIPYETPGTDSENEENLQVFMDACSDMGMVLDQVIDPMDLSVDGLTAIELLKAETRVMKSLITLGIVSNEMGQCPVKMQVKQSIDMDEIEKKTARSVRSGGNLASPSLLVQDSARSSKKFSIRRMPREKSQRMSLSSKSMSIRGGGLGELKGKNSLTPEQMAEFQKLTGGATGAFAGLSVEEETSSAPPATLTPLKISKLSAAMGARDTTMKLDQPSMFGVSDLLQVDDEMMQVMDTGKKFRVQRGAGGTKSVPHKSGATVTLQQAGAGLSKDYVLLRNRAVEEDFDDLDGMDFLELLEMEGDETHIFIYIVCDRYNKQTNVNEKGSHDTDRLLSYIIQRLETVTKENYSILFFHSPDANHQLELTFLSRMWSVLSRDFKQNLQNLWIIHPTFWIKTAFFFCSPFLDSSVTAKVAVCQSIQDLYNDFESEGLPLPPEIYKNEKQKKAWFGE